jgi:hypothetical protein
MDASAVGKRARLMVLDEMTNWRESGAVAWGVLTS